MTTVIIIKTKNITWNFVLHVCEKLI